jgi:hypothetical protein
MRAPLHDKCGGAQPLPLLLRRRFFFPLFLFLPVFLFFRQRPFRLRLGRLFVWSLIGLRVRGAVGSLLIHWPLTSSIGLLLILLLASLIRLLLIRLPLSSPIGLLLILLLLSSLVGLLLFLLFAGFIGLLLVLLLFASLIGLLLSLLPLPGLIGLLLFLLLLEPGRLVVVPAVCGLYRLAVGPVVVFEPDRLAAESPAAAGPDRLAVVPVVAFESGRLVVVPAVCGLYRLAVDPAAACEPDRLAADRLAAGEPFLPAVAAESPAVREPCPLAVVDESDPPAAEPTAAGRCDPAGASGLARSFLGHWRACLPCSMAAHFTPHDATTAG